MGEFKFELDNNTVVVTGGAQGIGRQIAISLLQAKVPVSIWDYDRNGIEVLRGELAQFGDLVDLQVVDVSDPLSCESAAANVPGQQVSLVNNAGITRDKTFKKMDAAEFDQVVRTNLNGSFYVTKALLPRLGSGSRIINLSSVVALYGNFGQTNYAAAKAGLIGMTKTLARELGPKGVTVNAIAPGFIKTPMTDKVPADLLEQVIAKNPLRRMGEPEDIANACLFLLSKGAAYVNGAVLSVDGGSTV